MLLESYWSVGAPMHFKLAHFLLLGEIGDELDGTVWFPVSKRALRSVSLRTTTTQAEKRYTFTFHDRDWSLANGLPQLLHDPQLRRQPSWRFIQGGDSILVFKRCRIKVRNHLIALSHMLRHG